MDSVFIVGMASAKFSKPLLFESKLLCFSVFYLFTSLFLALYSALSSTKCIFRSSPFDPIQSPLFTYPSSYGQHKHSLPTLRSSCTSPVFFSGTIPKHESLILIKFSVCIACFYLWGFVVVRLLDGCERNSRIFEELDKIGIKGC